MSASIDFYFDFSSPYGYLASEKIEAMAARHTRGVDWHPILLGVIFKQTGAAPLTMVPLKGDYSRRDMPRSARMVRTRWPSASRKPVSGSLVSVISINEYAFGRKDSADED